MLTPQTTVTPNAVMIKNVIFPTDVVSGSLRTGAIITLSAAAVDAQSKWTQVGADKTIHIADVANLPPDLASLQEQANTAMTLLIGLVDQINAIRKVV